MNILVTGSDGFLGKNLIARLRNLEAVNTVLTHKKSSSLTLEKYIQKSDFIFHFAGSNRPKDRKEFYTANSELTKKIIYLLEKNNKFIPILFTSSVQIKFNNDYGNSKLIAEELIRTYSNKHNVATFIYRLPGVFGKWSKPNYNSVIATWCHNIANNKPIQIDNPNDYIDLVYIDDVIDSFISKLNVNTVDFECSIKTTYQKKLLDIAHLLYDFKKSRTTLKIETVGSGFKRALYTTYLSFLPPKQFIYNLPSHEDERGAFYEVLKTIDSGQLSVSTTKPGESVRGNHYHHTKNEKFLLVKGKAIIQMRNIYDHDIIEFTVSDTKMQIVEIIPGYTHNIRNISDEKMVLLIWANEVYDKEKPDTYYLGV